MKFLSFLLLIFSPLIGAEVVFISFHPAPSEHFKEFVKVLSDHNISSVLIGNSLSQKIWKEGKLIEKNEEALNTIISEVSQSKLVITDSDPFSFKIHQALLEKSPFARRLFYYDNPQAFVPGGYSENIKKMALAPLEGVIFSNFHLAGQPILENPHLEIDFGKKQKWDLGYYPLHDVDQIKQQRLKKEKNPRLTLLYIGAANQEYYEKIIPHFVQLLLLSDPLENIKVIFQQHPRAKMEGNLDVSYIQRFKKLFDDRAIEFVFSDKPLIEMAAVADGILYSQSSAAPKFVLAGIPTIQIGPSPFEDILIKNNIVPSVQNAESFIKELSRLSCNDEKAKQVLFALGIREDWKNRLIEIVKKRSDHEKS